MKLEHYSQSTDRHGSGNEVAMRFLDELCGIDDFHRGVARGAAKRAEELSEMVLHPDVALRETVRNVGSAVSTAKNYYRQTAAEQVAKDAADAILELGNVFEDYRSKSQEKRGEVCAGIALDLFLGEAIVAGLARSTLLASESARFVSLQSRSDMEFDAIVASLRVGTNAELGGLVKSLTSALPRSIKDFIASQNIEVIPVSSIASVEPSCVGAAGMFTVRGGKPFIFIAAHRHLAAGALEPKRLELTLRHEITHAIDYLTTKGTCVSDSPRFAAIFDQEFAALHPAQQKALLETIGNGSRKITRREVVAELVSRRAVPDGGTLEKFFFGAFPKLDRALQAKDSPFLPH